MRRRNFIHIWVVSTERYLAGHPESYWVLTSASTWPGVSDALLVEGIIIPVSNIIRFPPTEQLKALFEIDKGATEVDLEQETKS